MVGHAGPRFPRPIQARRSRREAIKRNCSIKTLACETKIPNPRIQIPEIPRTKIYYSLVNFENEREIPRQDQFL